MSDVINMLLQEHRNISRVLDLIQRQTANLDNRAPVNYRLLDSCFQYLSSYPEKCHHPKEDLVYRKLLSNCPDIVDSLRDLVDEHETLAHFTRNLRRSVAVMQHQLPTVNTRLAENLTTYVDAYHMHMATEERCFFPLAVKRLTADNFAEIDFTLFDQPDHLFDREAEEKLAELHHAISQSGAVEDLSADHREEAALLAALRDITNFNDAMQRAGDPVLLARSTSGGYELKDGGQVLLHIPPCSESRAAWCAYYYRKATNQPDNVVAIDRAG
jgi:hemerythrin-like domain-containing protein